MSYSNPLTETLFFEVQLQTFQTTIMECKAPPGKTGRLVRMSSVTNGGSVTGGPTFINVGTLAVPDAYGTLTVPDGQSQISDFVRGAVDRIPEGTVVQVEDTGDADFGPTLQVSVVIEWS